MELNEDTVKRIAELSRLAINDQEVKEYQHDLQKILDAFQKLANTPLPSELQGDARSALILKQSAGLNESISRMQEDKEDNSLATPTFLAQAPQREGVFVRVPAILSPST